MRIAFSYGGASAVLEPVGDSYSCARLIALRSASRGKGHATEVMRKIIKYADENGLVLVLFVQANGPRDILNNRQLEAFYKKFGFEIQPEQKWPQGMIRWPSQEIHAS